MTRRLALMLAIAILLLVNTTIGEGGALDDIASHNGAQVAAADEGEQVASDNERSTLAVASTSPWAVSNGSPRNGEVPVIGTWGEETEETVPAPPVPAEPRRSLRSDVRGSQATRAPTPEEGALERHRLNIEE